MTWKGIKLEFGNMILNVASNGEFIRIRKNGMKPIQERLTKDVSGSVKIEENAMFQYVPKSKEKTYSVEEYNSLKSKYDELLTKLKNLTGE